MYSYIFHFFSLCWIHRIVANIVFSQKKPRDFLFVGYILEYKFVVIANTIFFGIQYLFDFSMLLLTFWSRHSYRILKYFLPRIFLSYFNCGACWLHALSNTFFYLLYIHKTFAFWFNIFFWLVIKFTLRKCNFESILFTIFKFKKKHRKPIVQFRL